jgi:tryptophan halogenase
MVGRCCYNGGEEMKINKVKKIIIFGGGTSGWLTAAYLTKNLKFPCEIMLIESTDIGPIGVGEGTQPATARFLHDCGIDPKTWMKPSQASFKLGVEFKGWTDTDYFVDNDFIENSIMGPKLFTSDYFVSRDKQDFIDWLPAYRLAKANKSPKLAGFDANTSLVGYRQFGAVHFSAYEIVESIKHIILDRIHYVNTKITSSDVDENGITHLIDQDGVEYSADLYLDCTGFSSILLEKTLGVEFTSITDILPCDKAVVMPTQYTDPETECFPYTKATAMHSGWMFTIPIFTRTGNGYVYSSKFLSPEYAELELRKTLNDFETPVKHLDMKCGIHNTIAYKNVCAIGLAAGFVEPLEATGITFTTSAVELLTDALNITQGIWNPTLQKNLNDLYQTMFWEIVAFVWIHYHYSTKDNTPFWNSIRQQSTDTVPPQILKYIEAMVPSPNTQLYHHSTSSFHVGHWFSVLNAGGVYKNHPPRIAGDVEKYAEYFIKLQNTKVDLVKETFPNHYAFLKEWYGKE